MATTAKKELLGVEFGLLRDGVEAWQYPSTMAAQKLQQRFKLSRVVLVGDRGMLTDARIREDLKFGRLDWLCMRPGSGP